MCCWIQRYVGPALYCTEIAWLEQGVSASAPTVA
jgi:hypothetical protein